MTKLQPMLSNLIDSLKKYKYAVLVLLLGVCIMLIPQKKSPGEELSELPLSDGEDTRQFVSRMEAHLEESLSQIDGVGAVDVILTVKQGSTKHYLYDTDSSREEEEGGTRITEQRKTVILSKSGAYDEATVTTVDYPLFQGALVVCEGGGRPEIQLLLTQVISSLTNLGSDKIAIVKMK